MMSLASCSKVLVRNLQSLAMKQPRHIANGEAPCPALVEGSLRVYNMRYCPYAERALLALVHKNVKFDVVNINLVKKPDWFLELARPAGAKVPVLHRPDGSSLGESLVVMEYIDRAYPGPGLLPEDAWKAGQDKVFVEEFANGAIASMAKMFNPHLSDEEKAKVMGKIEVSFVATEKELRDRGTKFFHGDQPGFVDFSLWPWFERRAIFASMCKKDPWNKEDHPKLTAWVEDMLVHPTVVEVLVPVEEMNAFFKSYALGAPQYDDIVVQQTSA